MNFAFISNHLYALYPDLERVIYLAKKLLIEMVEFLQYYISSKQKFSGDTFNQSMEKFYSG